MNDVAHDEAFEPARPPYVRSDTEVERWKLSVAIAVHVMQEPPDSEDVWFAARSLYSSDLPT